jgi:hypothetical protein
MCRRVKQQPSPRRARACTRKEFHCTFMKPGRLSQRQHSTVVRPIGPGPAPPGIGVCRCSTGVAAKGQLTFGLRPELRIVTLRASTLLPKLQRTLLDLLVARYGGLHFVFLFRR